MEPAREKGYVGSLSGTIYRTYLQLLFYQKTKLISEDDFATLHGRLLSDEIRQRLSAKERTGFRLTGFLIVFHSAFRALTGQ